MKRWWIVVAILASIGMILLDMKTLFGFITFYGAMRITEILMDK